MAKSSDMVTMSVGEDNLRYVGPIGTGVVECRVDRTSALVHAGIYQDEPRPVVKEVSTDIQGHGRGPEHARSKLLLHPHAEDVCHYGPRVARAFGSLKMGRSTSSGSGQ